MRNTFWRTVILCGLIAGTLDIGAAALINHVGPVVILHAIARGLLGKAAMTGGAATAVLGLGLQWTMSILIAAIYGLVAQRARLGARLWPLWGVLAGGVIFAVMEFVVVPLSAVRKVSHFTPTTLALNLVAMVLFGLILAYGLRGHGRRA